MTRWALAAATSLVMGAWIGACGSSDDTTPGADVDAGGEAGFVDPFGDQDASAQPIEIVPANPVINATGQPVTEAFKVVVKGTQNVLNGSWTADQAAIGIIGGGSGLFTANGTTGGVVNVTAQVGTQTATTTLTVKVALTDINGVSSADQAALAAGGPLTNDAAFRWLYPYDKTVFPRGLRAPLLQFGGTAPDVVLVHTESQYMTYDGFFGASNPGRVTLDETRWKAITQSAGGADKVTIKLTKKSGTVVTGPVNETWTVAAANLKGTVYYNTYNTPQAGGSGALLKVRPGSTQDAEVFMGGCTVCHSVSANGNVITTGVGWTSPDPTTSGTFTVGSNGDVPRAPDGSGVPTYSEAKGRFAFGGLTPDGKYVMTHANQPGGVRGLTPASGAQAGLYDSATGKPVTTQGFVHPNAQMPSFSPDGKRLVFNNRDAAANVSGKVLTVYDFDQATLAFTNPADVWTDDNLVAWPTFLPDSKSVVFHVGNDFGTQSQTSPTDIALVDVATKTKMALPALNGFDGTDAAFATTYLPYGETAEGHLNYEPTVLPVAAGGYYWVIFTSRRCYGNVFDSNQNAWGGPGGGTELSPRKKLWVAAIDLNATPGQDRSHPAFYLPGQETNTGNMRGFWALDACHNDGASCESGDECCNGYCRQVTEADGAAAYTCTSTPAGCSQEFEKCSSDGECCGAQAGAKCINGHCAAASVPR